MRATFRPSDEARLTRAPTERRGEWRIFMPVAGFAPVEFPVPVIPASNPGIEARRPRRSVDAEGEANEAARIDVGASE